MRFLDIDLIRWGGFTERHIGLDSAARLHVIYGPNEAGKTTLLRGIRDLLYGIEARTSYDFIHAMNTLSLGGTLTDRDGNRLSFHRRKGNKNTLLDQAQRPLADGALAPFLCGVDKRTFEDLFGLDHAAMRAGGEAMLQAEGDLGSSLFAASSGLRRLVQVRKRLAEEAEALFAPRRKADRAFYAGLDRLGEAQRQLREANLLPDDWRRLERDHAAALAQRSALSDEAGTIRRRRDRLEALRRAAPLLRDIARLETELAELATAPVLPEDFERRLLTSETELASARAAAEQIAATLVRILGERDAIGRDDVVLAAAPAIEGVFSRIGSLARDKADIAKLDRDLRLYEEEIVARLAMLGEAAGDSGPSEADAAVLRALAARQQALLARRDEAQERLAAARQNEEAATAERDRCGSVPAPVREQALLDQLRQQGDVDGLAAAAGQTAADAARTCGDSLQRLGLGRHDLAVAAALPVPAATAVDAFAERFCALAERRRDLEAERKRGQGAAADARDQIATLEAGGDVPTADRVAAARGHRDAGWRLVRRLYVALEPDAAAAAATFAGPASLPEAYEQAVTAADTLADRRDAEATRVARHGELARIAAQHDAAAAAADAALLALDATEATERQRWLALWRGCRIEPQEPAAMRDWLRRFDDFLRLRTRRADAEAAAAAAAAARDGVRSGLARLQVLLGGAQDDTLPTRDLLAEADARLKAQAAAALAAERAALAAAAAQRLHADEQRQAAQAEAALAQWREEWNAALAKVGLAGDLAPEATEVMLRGWGEIRGLRTRQAETRRRLAGLTKDTAAFETEIAALVARLAPDLTLPPDQAVEALRERLRLAREAETQLQALARRIDELRRQQEELTTTIERHEAALARLRSLVGAASPEDVPEQIALARRRAGVEKALAERRHDLATAVPGRDAGEIAEALAAEGLDDKQLDAEIDRLGDRAECLGEELAEVATRVQAIAAEMTAIRGAADAASAAQDLRSAIADLRATTMNWMRTRAAELLLARSIERFRTESQDPVVRRAGAIFRRVTLGAYAGLAVDFDDADRPVLIGIDRDESRCPVARMSDGSRDQLYLALRIAAVERYAAQAEPMPFIADDLFINWDDARTGEGLRALAELGEKTQVILLTHHLAVVDSARRVLPQAALQVIGLSEATLQAAEA